MNSGGFETRFKPCLYKAPSLVISTGVKLACAAVLRADIPPDHRPCCVDGTCRVLILDSIEMLQKLGSVKMDTTLVMIRLVMQAAARKCDASTSFDASQCPIHACYLDSGPVKCRGILMTTCTRCTIIAMSN
eukprot:6466808-Amphidinium_carterae.3